nr:hypothetical protein [Tanacetum cinerariifolium]
MFDEYFNPPTITVSPVQEAAAQRAMDLADFPVPTSIDQDAPSAIQEAAARRAMDLADFPAPTSIDQDAPSASIPSS